MGVAVVKNNYWTIFKTLDLTLLEIEINNNIREFRKIGTIIRKTNLNNETEGLEKQIEYLILTTKDRLSQIKPSSIRTKRAIFSPLGSLIKVISGNLDESDAIMYNNKINNLQAQEHTVERKVSSLQKAFDKLVNASEIINTNINKLGSKTSEMDILLQNEFKFNNLLHIINSMYQFLSNFRTINEHLQEIETAIGFSKLGILHQSIINSTELLVTLKIISKHAKTVYPVNKDNLIKLERNIKLKSYISNDNLIFVLEVPLVDNDTYNYYKVIPIPIIHSFKTYTIIPKYPFLLVNRLKYRPIASPCEEIESGKFLCAEEQLAQYPSETCIEEIMMMKNQYNECLQKEIKIERTKIQKITDDYWLIYSEDSLVISENCNNEVRKFNARGTYILTPSQHCETQAGNVLINTASNITSSSLRLPVVPIPDLDFIIKKETTPVDLTNVDFSDVKQVLQSAKFSVYDNVSRQTLVTLSVSIWTVLLYICIPIVIVIVILIKYRNKVFSRNSPRSPTSSSDNFALEEGGVKCANPAQYAFVSK